MRVTINSATGNLEADFPDDRPLTSVKREAMSQLDSTQMMLSSTPLRRKAECSMNPKASENLACLIMLC